MRAESDRKLSRNRKYFRRLQNAGQTQSALARLEAGVALVNDVYPALAPDDATIFVAPLGRAQRVENFHRSGFLGAFLMPAEHRRAVCGCQRRRGGLLQRRVEFAAIDTEYRDIAAPQNRDPVGPHFDFGDDRHAQIEAEGTGMRSVGAVQACASS